MKWLSGKMVSTSGEIMCKVKTVDGEISQSHQNQISKIEEKL